MKSKYEYAVALRVNKTAFSPSHKYGRHKTNIEAKRAYVTRWNPNSDVASWPDLMVKQHFDAVARNEKSVKILKIPIE